MSRGIGRGTGSRLAVFAAMAVVVLTASVGAEETDWKVGDFYRITAQRGDAEMKLEGVLAKATDRWLVLVDNDRRTEYGVPMFSKIPYLNRMFVNVGHIDSTIWIPRDAAIIELREKAKKQPTGEPLIGDEPQLKKSCTVELASGESASALLAVDGDQLTLATYKRRQLRPKTVALRDVLYVSFEDYSGGDSNPGVDFEAAIHAK